MKEAIKTFLIILFFITSVVFAFKYFTCKNEALPHVSKNVELDSGFLVKPIQEYTDSHGVTHMIIDKNVNSVLQKEIDKQATAKALEISPIIDEVAKSLDIKPKQVEGVTNVQVGILYDSIKVLNKELNILNNKTTYTYKDKYVDLNFTKDLDDTADLGIFDYRGNTDLNITQYWKKKNFLSKKKSYLDISSSNDKMTVMGVKKFTVVQEQPEFGLRLQAMYLHNFYTGANSVGVSARADMFKGSIRGAYYYNLQSKRWVPTITIEKDLIRF